MSGAFPATLTTASILGLLLLVLAFQCVSARLGQIKAASDAQDAAEAAVQLAMRVMGNFSEYVPLALILLLGLEASAAPSALVYGLAGALIVARLLHAWGLSRNPGRSFGRFWGTLLTWIMILVASLSGLFFVLIA